MLVTDEHQLNFILKDNANSEPEIPEEKIGFEPPALVLDKNEKTCSKQYLIFLCLNLFFYKFSPTIPKRLH